MTKPLTKFFRSLSTKSDFRFSSAKPLCRNVNFISAFPLVVLSCQSLGQMFSIQSSLVIADGFGFNHPQIELMADGQPGVLWTSASDNNVYFSKYDGLGSFSSPVQLNPAGVDAQTYSWSGPDLAVEGNNVYVAFKQDGYSTGHIYLVKSIDGGLSFGDTVRIDNLATGFGQYPDIAVLNDTLYVTFMAHDATGMNPQYVVSRSTDGGLSFETEVLAGELLGNEACDCCPPEIIATASEVVIFFRDNNSDIRDIKAIISEDRAVTFTTSFSPDDHSWNITSCPSTGPDARIRENNNCITVYRSEFDDSAKIYVNEYNLTTATDAGTAEIRSATGSHLSVNYPQLYTEDESAVVVWEETDQNTDVFINASGTGPLGFEPANSFNITDSSGNQVKPDVALKDGVIHVVYASNATLNLRYVQLISPLVSVACNTNKIANVLVYPNPAGGWISLLSETVLHDESKWSISDITGRILASDNWNGQKIDISNLESGDYLLTFESADRANYVKFTVRR